MQYRNKFIICKYWQIFFLLNMKNNILQALWIYEKWPSGRLKWLFHKYSLILEEVIHSQTIWKQDILYLDEHGSVFHLGQEIYWVNKIMALIAIGKQKKTHSKSIAHEKLLNIHWVIRKDNESTAPYNQRFIEHGIKPIEASHAGWNHLIPLSEALNSVIKLESNDRELRIILSWIIMTYLSIQWIPLWLVIDGVSSDWDDIILEMMDDFNPEKFILQARKGWYGELVDDIIDNIIFSTTHDVIERISNNAWLYLNPLRSWEDFERTHSLIQKIKTESRQKLHFSQKHK